MKQKLIILKQYMIDKNISINCLINANSIEMADNSKWILWCLSIIKKCDENNIKKIAKIAYTLTK